jgi:hypothetical protein
MGWVVSVTFQPLYPQGRTGFHCIGGWVGSRAGVDGCANSRLQPGFDPTGRPDGSESLYRQRYPANILNAC